MAITSQEADRILNLQPKGNTQSIGFPEGEPKSGPSLGSIGKGLVAEIAIGESAKYAGTTAGAAVGGPIGAIVGYLSGAVGGGISGSLAAQRLEGRDNYSWGRVAADTLLNVIPFAGGKGAKTAKLFPKLGKRALTGAGISAGAAQIEKGIEEGRLLTPTELLVAGATGGALNIGIGAAGDALGDIYRKKISGKKVDEVQKAYDNGDADVIALIDSVTKQGDPEGRFTRFQKSIMSYALPSRVLGNKSSAEVRNAMSKSEAAMDLANRARTQINSVYKDLDDEGKKVVDSYILGETKALPQNLQELKATIDSARSKLDEYQDTVIDLYDKGVLDMNELTYNKIVQSRSRGDYLTTEYRFFLDDSYQPTKEQTEALFKRLTTDLGSERKAAEKIRNLIDLKDDPESINDILKRKEIQTEEMQDYLGLITDPGERFAGTIQKLGRLAATKDGDRKLTERFVLSGVGEVANSESDIQKLLDADYVPLRIRGKIQDKYGRERVEVKVDKYEDKATQKIYNSKDEALLDGVLPESIKHITSENILRGGSQVYVPREINTAVDLLSRKTFKEDSTLWSENLVSQLLGTTTAFTKFAKVPLSVAAYPVQLFGNMAMVSAMGMNPFKNYIKNFRVALSDLNTKNFREGKIAKELTLKRMNRLKELNLIDKGISAGEIREGFDKGFFGKKLGEFTEPVGKAYSTFDTAQRITVFDNYKGLLKKIMSEDDFNRLGGFNGNSFEEIAAELTNATYQNYSRINPGVRYFSRIGVLNEFVSFNLEQMRTLFNQGALIRNLKSGKFRDDILKDYGVNLDQSALNIEANKRLTSTLAMVATATAGVTAINRKIQGVNSEEEKALRETVVPVWDEDSKLLIKKDGDKIKTANLSYQIPIAELTSVFESGLRGDDPISSVGNVFSAMWNKFGGSGTINATNFFAALANRDPRTGRPISDEPGGIGQFADRFLYYAGKSFTPTGLGKTSDKTTPDLITRYLLGLRNQNTTIEQGAGFKFRALKDNFNNIRRSYSSDLYQDKDMTKSYQERNVVYQRNLSEVIKHVDNLRILGKTDEEIDKILVKSNLSKAIRSDALAGEIGNMPLAVGVSGNRAERKKKLVELYDKLPPSLGDIMLNEARDSGKIKQSVLNEVIRQSQFQRLNPNL